jgi:hypothetical protein
MSRSRLCDACILPQEYPACCFDTPSTLRKVSSSDVEAESACETLRSLYLNDERRIRISLTDTDVLIEGHVKHGYLLSCFRIIHPPPSLLITRKIISGFVLFSTTGYRTSRWILRIARFFNSPCILVSCSSNELPVRKATRRAEFLRFIFNLLRIEWDMISPVIRLELRWCRSITRLRDCQACGDALASEHHSETMSFLYIVSIGRILS